MQTDTQSGKHRQTNRNTKADRKTDKQTDTQIYADSHLGQTDGRKQLIRSTVRDGKFE